MNTPKQFLRDYIFAPSYKLLKNIKYYSVNEVLKPSLNFLFEHSKETALMLVIMNALSTISGHIAQIGGLKRSNRENKDYLIKQEKVELICDIPLAVMLPVWLTRQLKLKFYSGQWTTKSSVEKMVKELAPVAGVSKSELYNTEHIRPFSETLAKCTNSGIKYITKKFPNLPNKVTTGFNKLSKAISKKIPDPNSFIPGPTLEEITIEEAARFKNGAFKNFYNGNAYDEFCGQFNGLIALSTIFYTVVASSIITPIIRNLLANYFNKKQMKKTGETPESIARKKRFAYTDYPVQKSNIYYPFTHQVMSVNPDKKDNKKSADIFSNFNTFKSGSMKI